MYCYQLTFVFEGELKKYTGPFYIYKKNSLVLSRIPCLMQHNVCFQLKLKLLQECENITENKLSTAKMNIQFCSKDVDPASPSETYLPVLVHSCPSNFSTVQYFEVIFYLFIYLDKFFN